MKISKKEFKKLLTEALTSEARGDEAVISLLTDISNKLNQLKQIDLSIDYLAAALTDDDALGVAHGQKQLGRYFSPKASKLKEGSVKISKTELKEMIKEGIEANNPYGIRYDKDRIMSMLSDLQNITAGDDKQTRMIRALQFAVDGVSDAKKLQSLGQEIQKIKTRAIKMNPAYTKRMEENEIIQEELNIFLKENNLKKMSKEEISSLIKEGLLSNIASKLNMKPAMAAMAIGLFLNSGAAQANTGNPQVDNIIQQIEKFSNLDLNKDGKIGSGAASSEKSKETESIRTFKSTAEAEKATGHKTTKAYKTQLAAANATSDMQNQGGGTYRGVVKVGDSYHGLYTPFGTR